jgi:hypothetical protein
LRQVAHLRNVENARCRNGGRAQILEELLHGVPARDRRHVAMNGLPLLVTAFVGRTHGVGDAGKFRHRGQAAPLHVAADREINEAVPGRIDVGRDELAVLVAGARDLVRLAIEIDQGEHRDEP